MRQKAIVTSVDGNMAWVCVTRASMCDGCPQQGCEKHTCAAGALMGNHKQMTAKAKNTIGASVGDEVWIETETGRVLAYAALVFLAPILLCGLFWLLANACGASAGVACVAGCVGFVGTFVCIGMVEKKKEDAGPDAAIIGYASEKENTL